MSSNTLLIIQSIAAIIYLGSTVVINGLVSCKITDKASRKRYKGILLKEYSATVTPILFGIPFIVFLVTKINETSVTADRTIIILKIVSTSLTLVISFFAASVFWHHYKRLLTLTVEELIAGLPPIEEKKKGKWWKRWFGV